MAVLREQGRQESNLRHPVLETGALASELHPFGVIILAAATACRQAVFRGVVSDP